MSESATPREFTPFLGNDMKRDCLRLAAPAKVNLYLRILGRRADGYHELESLMAKFDVCDEIVLHKLRAPRLRLRCTGHPELENAQNLVARAVQALLPAGSGAEIHLHKTLPMGAGLGGGSSDAAATILGMQRLFELNLPESKLHEIAAGLGADVPFFLIPATYAIAQGTGTQLTPQLDLPQLHMVVIYPGFGVPTAWAYQQYAQRAGTATATPGGNFLTLSSRNDTDFSRSSEKSSDSEKLLWVVNKMHNDLEEVVAAEHAAIPQLKARLLEAGALAAMMSGSGSSIFGVFAGATEARRAAHKLSGDKRLWCRAVSTLRWQQQR